MIAVSPCRSTPAQPTIKDSVTAIWNVVANRLRAEASSPHCSRMLIICGAWPVTAARMEMPLILTPLASAFSRFFSRLHHGVLPPFYLLCRVKIPTGPGGLWSQPRFGSRTAAGEYGYESPFRLSPNRVTRCKTPSRRHHNGRTPSNLGHLCCPASWRRFNVLRYQSVGGAIPSHPMLRQAAWREV